MTNSSFDSEDDFYHRASVVQRLKCTQWRQKKEEDNWIEGSAIFVWPSQFVDLFHLCADWSKACFPPVEIDRVVNTVSYFRRAFSPLKKKKWGHEIHCNIESQDKIAVSKTSCLSSGYFHPESVEGLGSDVWVYRRPSAPHRRRACHPCQHTVVSSQQVLSINHSEWS